MNKQLLSSLIFISSLTLSPLSHSAGLWLYEFATPEMGTASAGRNATADSASTAMFNPAGMTRLDRDELMVGFQPMYIKARFDLDAGSGSGGGDGGNAGGWVPVASISYVRELSPDLKLGIASGSYLGLGLDFNSDWGGRYFVTEGEILTLSTTVSLGYKVNDKFSIGGGLNIIYGSLSQEMNWNNNPLGAGNATDGRIKIDDSDL